MQTHMTNTRNTPIEEFERSFPAFIERLELRSESGGSGQYLGGKGLCKVLISQVPLNLQLITERRRRSPQGSHGGSPASPGAQAYFQNGSWHVLPAKGSFTLLPNTPFRMETPGGGGFGRKLPSD
jgi:N-methylhydantoinase B